MTREEILHRLQEICRDVFSDEALIVSETSNADTIEGWDSLNHVILVAAIQSDLEISFALGELQELKNVGDMVEIIQSKLD